MSHMLPLDGYGYAAIKIGEALRRLDPAAQVVDMTVNGRAPKKVMPHQTNGPAVVMTVPDWWESITAAPLIGYTMFETTRMPAGRVEDINHYAAACLVPCQWCADSFAAQGVTVPIRVVPWGIDAADYYPLERPERDQPYTFLWSGTNDLRKGWDKAYLAFRRAFGDREDVRLRLHFRKALPLGVKRFRDRNVETVVGMFDRPALREMLQAADCYVFPSRGEGWGLPPREAAATGLPVIATDWGGLAEEITEWAIPLRVDDLSSASFSFWEHGEIGRWAEPSLEHLIELMRWCESHRREAAGHGRQSARWLAENTPWTRTALELLLVMEELGYAHPVHEPYQE